MKPTKNRIFCKDCGRHKMLFETEKKANNFIKFNSDEIESESGFAPQRSYFCLFCDGWHVTNIKENIGMSFKEKTVRNFLENKPPKIQKPKEDHQKFELKIKSEIEEQIKEMAPQEIQLFFNQKITAFQEEIESLKSNIEPGEKEKLKNRRKELAVFYIIRKELNLSRPKEENQTIQKTNEWEEWFNNHSKKSD